MQYRTSKSSLTYWIYKMNSVILSNFDLVSENKYLLDQAATKHLQEIVNIQVGDTLKVTILNQGLATAKVSGISDKVELEIIDNKAGLSFPIHFIIGASRPPTMKKVLEHGSSLGISSFHIMKGELSEKSYLQSKLYKNDEYKKLTRLGLSQSAVFFKDPNLEVETFYSQLNLPSTAQKYILSPYADKHIKDISIDISKDSIFAIGPERGWTEAEVQSFKDKGYQEVKLSPSILRVEIASFALLGHLNQLM